MLPLELEEFIYSLSESTFLKKGAFLYKEGEIIQNFYMVKSGMVKVSKKLADDREVTVQLAKKDEAIGEGGFFALLKHTVSAEVIEDSEIAFVNKELFQAEILKDSNLLLQLIKWLDILQLKNQSKIRDLTYFGKKGAMYSTLIRLSNTFGIIKIDGTLINLKLTNQTLSDLCGATRESVNKMLSHLETNGVISVDHKYIKIHNLDYLKKESSCEDCSFEICQM